MNEPNQHPDQTTSIKNNEEPIWKRVYNSGFFGLLVWAIAFIIIVILLGFSIDDQGDRVNAWVVGILTVISVFLFIINTVTSREMVDIMTRQESEMAQQRQAMLDALERTDELLKQNERMIGEVEKQAKAAETQNALTEQSVELASLSAKITEDQLQLAKLTQRPDIDLILTFEPIDIDGKIWMLFNCPNVGASTAYKFGIHISAEFTEVDYNGVLYYGKPRPSEAEPIRKGVPNFVQPEAFPAHILQIRPMLKGKNWFIVFGIYWYYDGAGNRYEEIFCRRFNHLDPANAVQCEGSLRAQIVE